MPKPTTTFVISDLSSPSMPALPAARNVKSLSIDDAARIIVAVYEGLLPAMARRFNKSEHASVEAGDVYVYAVTAALDDDIGEGFERFTDGRAWKSGRCRRVSHICQVMSRLKPDESPIPGFYCLP